MNVLITGGTGSLGTVLSKKFLSLGYNLTILNKDSHKQAAIRKVLPSNVRYFLADICDRDAVRDACRGQDIVVHAAAIKRLEMGDWFPEQMSKVNIQGTENVARACKEAHVRRCLLISSDKSSGPTFYGVTKKVAEGVWLAHDTYDQYFAALRYGNVVNSNGSVWHLWNDALAQGKKLIVRTPEPTRFILNLKQAVQLVIETLHQMPNDSGCVYIPSELPAFSVWDLACAMQPDENQWEKTGYFTNERQHEQLIADDEFAKHVTDTLWTTIARYDMKLVDRKRFSSNTAPRLTGEQVVKFMKES